MGIWYDKKAYELLKKCSDTKDLTEWNEYRKATNYSSVNLRFANLSNFYLQKAEMQNVDLRGGFFSNANFNFSNVENLNISTTLFQRIFFLSYLIGFISTFLYALTGNLALTHLNTYIFGNGIFGLVYIVSVALSISYFSFANLLFLFTVMVNSVFFGSLLVFFKFYELLIIMNHVSHAFNDFSVIGILLFSILCIFGMLMYLIGLLSLFEINRDALKFINAAKNPDKIIYNGKKIVKQSNNIADELQKEASELGLAIKESVNDEEKQKLIARQKELEDKIEFYTKQEYEVRIQQTQIENVIAELQAPYEYIHQTITKIEWHNRFYYNVIAAFLGVFIYAVMHGYIDQKMATFGSLFTKDTLPSFGTIFGVILFYGSPVLIGISLIIYFIAQINKNIDKVTGLQEQERNIKQIASTIKAKAQVGMSDEEFVRETKNLIQKYQEGMMAGMFTREKTSDKEDKSPSSTYREKMMANGMSKLLTQALKR